MTRKQDAHARSGHTHNSSTAHSTAQRSTAQHSTAQRSTAQHSTAQHKHSTHLDRDRGRAHRERAAEDDGAWARQPGKLRREGGDAEQGEHDLRGAHASSSVACVWGEGCAWGVWGCACVGG